LRCIQCQARTYTVCVHLPSKYISALDGRTMPWDRKFFAYIGEIAHGTAITIQLPETAFRLVFNTRVKTIDHMVTHLDEFGALGQPFVLDDENESIAIMMHKMMYLPARYAALLLRTTGYQPREVWEVLSHAIMDAGDLAACKPLLMWLQVATTCTLLANQATGSPTIMITLVAPIADDNLLAHHIQIIQSVVPGLF
jgi:hypothetical protein